MPLRLMARGPAVVLIAALSLLSASALQGGAGAGSQDLDLTNHRLSLGFSRSDGRLIRLVDLETKMDFVDSSAADRSLWQIEFLPGCQPASLSPASAGSFRWQRVGGSEPGLRLIWDRFTPASVQRMRVTVSVRLDGKIPLSRWSIAIDNPGRLPIAKVRFPRVAHIRQQADERLAAPVWMGELTKDPRTAIADRPGQPSRLEWPYPGALSLQCLALYMEKGPGLYLSCNDTAAFRKAFAFWGDAGKKVGYEMIHLPENVQPPRASYAPPYDALIGTFAGDWIDASERYREWGTRQDWATHSRLIRSEVPDWLLKTGLWVWNRGRSEGVLKPASSLKRELGLPVSVFWHWWHGCAYDIGFPEYLPPREGTERFKAAVADAHRDGLHAIIYMNQRLWGMTTRSWKEKGAERYAVKTIDGTVQPEVYNTYTGQPCASMCMSTRFWRDTYAGIAEEAILDLDVDGIYMDQACSSLLCYDRVHGHPLGGGTFWMNGFRLLSTDIRNRTASVKKVLLAGEGSGEAWLPFLDLMLTLQVSRERYARPGDGWEIIPFFQSVYHDFGVTYGNYSSLTIPPYDELWPAEYAPEQPLRLLDRKYASQFYLEQARTFVWGVQPTISNFLASQLEERSDEIRFLMKLARLRYQGLQYLLYGKFLRPPQLDVPVVPVDISRLSIYAGRRAMTDPPLRKQASDDGVDDSGRGQPITQSRISSPGVLAGAWRAKDGSLGIAMASILDEPISVRVDLKPYGVSRGQKAFFIGETGRRELECSASEASIRVALGPRDACILEVPK